MIDQDYSIFFHSLDNELTKGGLPADFDGTISALLTALIEGQKKTLDQAEARFLRLGSDVNKLYGDSVALAKQVRDSMAMVGGDRDDSVLFNLNQDVTDSLTMMEKSQEGVDVILGHVDRLVNQLNESFNMCPELDKIARFLRVIGLNICVECSLSPEAVELFMTNAHEIRKFAAKVIEISKTIRTDTQKARDNLLASQQGINASVKEIKELAATAGPVVQEALQGIEHQLQTGMRAMAQAEVRSGVISRRMGEIVVALQFHDSMNQRIEHIHQGLREISLSPDPDNEKPSQPDGLEKIADIHALSALQADQARAVIKGLDTAYRQISQAFSAINKEITSLAGDLTSLNSLNSAASSLQEAGNDPFAVLQRALATLRKILAQKDSQVELIRAAGLQGSTTIARLIDNIDMLLDFNIEIKLKSLNSIITARRLGVKGRTIAVLANELKELAGNSNSFVHKIEKTNDSFALTISLLHGDTEDEASRSHSSDSLDSDIEEITRVRDNLSRVSTEVMEKTGGLSAFITHIEEELNFLPALAEELSEHLKPLDKLVAALSPWEGSLSEEIREKSARLAARYTMDHERLVHARLFAEDADSAAAPAGTEKDDGDMELFSEPSGSDNFEMFVQGTGPSSGEAEIFAAEERQEYRKKEEDDLGDNIELF